MKNLKIKNNYGLTSLILLGFSILSFTLFITTFSVNKIIVNFFFFAALISNILSFIIAFIGLIKDKKKIFAVISIIVILLLITGIIIYFNFILPKQIEILIDTWLTSWGINSNS